MSVISNTYTGDGVTDLFTFSFPYIDVVDVRVKVDDTELTPVVDWIFATGSTVQILTPPVVGSVVFIYRSTSDEILKASFFPGSAIRAKDLNDNFLQGLYLSQESTDSADSATASAEKAAKSAAEAANSAAQAASDAADATSAASEANLLATEAKQDAGLALIAATSASNDAAIAKTKADQALEAVLLVVPFEVVSNVAAIPPTPGDELGLKIIDSTGIESFSPLTGLPADFVGDPGIFVEILYDNGGSTWTYTGYNANDPDDRYEGALNSLPTTGGTMTGDITFAGSQPFPAASTTATGDVRLSNSFAGVSTSLAVTEKALSDGLSSVEIDIDALPSLP